MVRSYINNKGVGDATDKSEFFSLDSIYGVAVTISPAIFRMSRVFGTYGYIKSSWSWSWSGGGGGGGIKLSNKCIGIGYTQIT